MQYGYFEEQAREYVVTRPDTPAPWANYLGSPAYGALISNNAGGYSFVQSGANGRLLRYRFDGSDSPGRYLYLRDDEDGDFWSVSWQPVGKDLSTYRCECRHGLGYSRFDSAYRDIQSRAVYYVPEGESYEVWALTVRNYSSFERHLTLTGYAEFTNHSNYEQDQVNLQYSRFITRTFFQDKCLIQQIHGNLVGQPGASSDSEDVEERAFALAGLEVSSYCGDREQFLGAYHSYGNPVGVERGNLGNFDGCNEFTCGALSAKLVLQPGEEKSLVFLLGRKNLEEMQTLIHRYEEPCLLTRVERELQVLHNLWEERLASFQVKTPDADLNVMINTWNAYNCFMTFLWSRAASFTYCGLRNGYGYRDTVQDIQGIIHLAPAMAKDKIRFMLSAQVEKGAGLPLVKFTHNPGHEDTPDDPSYRKETGHPAYRADDALWLFPTVYKYLAETGDLAFLDEVIPYADQGEDTVYSHLCQAIRFSQDHLGPHGLPAGLYADWNDCLRLGEQGESVFVAMQYVYALRIMKLLAQKKQDKKALVSLEKELDRISGLVQRLCWEGDQFIRGFTQEGDIIGSKSSPEASLWLNPQTWGVISGLAEKDQAELSLAKVEAQLDTDFGAVLMDPPYHAHAFEGALMEIYNPGVKENSGIFSQSQGWLILAEALAGHGDRAYLYYRQNCPAAQNGKGEVRRLEPYCYGQFTEGSASPHYGRSHVHWLTGTASTVMVGTVEGILGMRPDLEGLYISPSIPSVWEGFELWKTFRGCRIHLVVENPSHLAKVRPGKSALILNGERLEGNYIPQIALKAENEVKLIL